VVTYGGGFHDIYLDAGNDIAYIEGFNVVVEGGTGNDHMWGLGGDEVFLYGESGTDILQGSHSDDYLDGGDNGDILIGAGGDDTLRGEGGDDNLQGGAGTDTVDGGANLDTCTDAFGSTTFIACETTVNSGPGGVTT
jgi:Ca2+-binding RTX toxin-like protein